MTGSNIFDVAEKLLPKDLTPFMQPGPHTNGLAEVFRRAVDLLAIKSLRAESSGAKTSLMDRDRICSSRQDLRSGSLFRHAVGWIRTGCCSPSAP
jgi:hypothetical protein